MCARSLATPLPHASIRDQNRSRVLAKLCMWHIRGHTKIVTSDARRKAAASRNGSWQTSRSPHPRNIGTSTSAASTAPAPGDAMDNAHRGMDGVPPGGHLALPRWPLQHVPTDDLLRLVVVVEAIGGDRKPIFAWAKRRRSLLGELTPWHVGRRHRSESTVGSRVRWRSGEPSRPQTVTSRPATNKTTRQPLPR